MTRALTLLAPCALLLASACNDSPPPRPPAFDRFYYPTGLAVRHVDKTTGRAGCALATIGKPEACQTQLFVVSSNFDVRYDLAGGGTVIAVDVDKALEKAEPSAAPVALTVDNGFLGAARVGSFGGEVAILDEESCPNFDSKGTPQVLVPSRSDNNLYRVDIVAPDASGNILSCGKGCAYGLSSTQGLGDPYGVTVACRQVPSTPAGKTSPQRLAFVTHLRAASDEGWLSQVDFDTGVQTGVDLGPSPTRSAAYDAAAARLWVSESFTVTSSANVSLVGVDPLRWLALDGSSVAISAAGSGSLNVFPLVRGAEVRTVALSQEAEATTPASRAYLGLRLYDSDVTSTTGVRPLNDIGGALAVLDISPGPDGTPRHELLRVIPLDMGASDVRVVPRDLDPTTGRPRKSVPAGAGGPRALRNLVAVTTPNDGTLSLYDDELGQIVKVFSLCDGSGRDRPPAPCNLGQPVLGRQPFGLAAEPLASGNARLFVGSFDQSWVNVIEIDPLHPSAGPVAKDKAWVRIGPERTR